MQLLVQLPVPAASPAQLPQQLLWKLPGPAKLVSDCSLKHDNINIDGETKQLKKGV